MQKSDLALALEGVREFEPSDKKRMVLLGGGADGIYVWIYRPNQGTMIASDTAHHEQCTLGVYDCYCASSIAPRGLLGSYSPLNSSFTVHTN